MTLSGTSNRLMTAEQMVQAAGEELGYISAGEAVSGQDLDLGIRQLNWMLKSLTARGVNLWREQDVTVAIAAGSAATVLDDGIEGILAARVQVPQGYQRELFWYERGEYYSLPNRATLGYPSCFYADRQLDAITLYLWPVPSTAMTVYLDVARAIGDVTLPDQTIDVPQKWTEAIYCSLAIRLAGPFGVTRSDPATVSRLEKRAASFEQLLFDEDRPASVYMGAQGGRNVR